MCGLVGIAGHLGRNEKEAFLDMLVFDSVRGNHSTGILGVNITGECLLAKSIGDPYVLFDRKQTDKVMFHAQTVLLGHNRFATVGNVSTNNAHPFEFNTLVGAHNGTLRNAWVLPSAKEYPVDSQRLFLSIEEKGLAPSIGMTLGAWALVWYDKVNDSINFLRNEERPLYYCLSEDDKNVFWASEGWMLSAALTRNSIKFKEIKVVPIDTHMEFALDGWKGVSASVNTPVKGKEVVVAETTYPYDNVPTKSSQTTSDKKVEFIDEEFVSAPAQKFRILTESTDIHGAKYLALQHPTSSSTIVRLYLKQDTMYLWGGTQQSIFAKVTSVKPSTLGLIYKCSLVNVPFAGDKKEEYTPPVTKEEHDLYYSTCSWCGDPLEYGDKEILYDRDGSFCGGCKTLEEVQPFIKGC